MTKVMQAAGLFEDFKVLIKPECIAPLPPETTIGGLLLLLDKLKEENDCILAFVPGLFGWYNTKVKAVSTGKQWMALSRLFESNGLKPNPEEEGTLISTRTSEES